VNLQAHLSTAVRNRWSTPLTWGGDFSPIKMDPTTVGDEFQELAKSEAAIRDSVGTSSWKAYMGKPICACHHKHLFEALNKTMYSSCKEIEFYVHPCCVECVGDAFASSDFLPNDVLFAEIDEVMVPCTGYCCDTKNAAYKETRDLVKRKIKIDWALYIQIMSQCCQQGRDVTNAQQKANAGAYLNDANFNLIRLAIQHSELKHEYKWVEAAYTLYPMAFCQIFAAKEKTYMLVRENPEAGVLGIYGSTPEQIYHAPFSCLIKYCFGNKREVWRGAHAKDCENLVLFASSPEKAIPSEAPPEDPVQLVRPTGGMPRFNREPDQSQHRHGHRFKMTDNKISGPTKYPHALGNGTASKPNADDPIDDASCADLEHSVAWLQPELKDELWDLVKRNANLTVSSCDSDSAELPPSPALSLPPGLEDFHPDEPGTTSAQQESPELTEGNPDTSVIACAVLSDFHTSTGNKFEDFFNPEVDPGPITDPLVCLDGYDAVAEVYKKVRFSSEQDTVRERIEKDMADLRIMDEQNFKQNKLRQETSAKRLQVVNGHTQLVENQEHEQPAPSSSLPEAYEGPDNCVLDPDTPIKEIWAEKDYIHGVHFNDMEVVSEKEAHARARELGKPVKTAKGLVVLPPGAMLTSGIKRAKQLEFATRVIANDFSTFTEDHKLMQGAKIPLEDFLRAATHYDKSADFAGMKASRVPNPLVSLKAFMRAFRRHEEEYGKEVGVSVVWDQNGMTIPANKQMDSTEDICYMYGHSWTNKNMDGKHVLTYNMSGQSQCASHPQAVQTGFEFVPMMYHTSTDGAVIQGLFTRLESKVILPKMTTTVTNTNKKKVKVKAKWVNKVDRVMKILEEYLITHKNIAELMVKYPDMYLLKSPTMTFERYHKGIEEIQRKCGDLGNVSAMIKIEAAKSKSEDGVAHNVDFSELHENAEQPKMVMNAEGQLEEEQPVPDDDKPRIIINDKDLFQLAILYAAKIFAKLFFDRKFRFHIKGCPKDQSMREMAALFEETFWHTSVIESDGKAWDTCCGPELRKLIENRILKKISKVLYSDGCDSTLPLQAREYEDKHRNADTVKVESDTVDAKAKKGSGEPKGYVIMRAIRRSGDGMTSAGNGLINLVLWAVCVLNRPELFFRDLFEGKWTPQTLYRYNEDIMGNYPTGDYRAGQPIKEYWGVFIPKVEGDDGAVGLTLPIVSTPEQFMMQEEHTGCVYVRGSKEPTETEYNHHFQMVADKVTEMLDKICLQWKDFGFNMSLKPLLRGSCAAASTRYLRITDRDNKLKCVVASKDSFNIKTTSNFDMINFFEFFTFTGFDFLICLVNEVELHTMHYHLPSLMRTLQGSAWSTSKLVTQPGPKRFANVHRVGYQKMMMYAINCVNHDHYSMYFEKSAQYHLQCLVERGVITDPSQIDCVACDEEVARKTGAGLGDIISMRDMLYQKRAMRTGDYYMYDLLATVSTGSQILLWHISSLNASGPIHPRKTQVELFFPRAFFRQMSYKEMHSNSLGHVKYMVGRMNTYGSEGPDYSKVRVNCSSLRQNTVLSLSELLHMRGIDVFTSDQMPMKDYECIVLTSDRDKIFEVINSIPWNKKGQGKARQIGHCRILPVQVLGVMNPYGSEGPKTATVHFQTFEVPANVTSPVEYKLRSRLESDGMSWDTCCGPEPCNPDTKVPSKVKMDWIVHVVHSGYLRISDLDDIICDHIHMPRLLGSTAFRFSARYSDNPTNEVMYRLKNHGTYLRIHASGPHLDPVEIKKSDEVIRGYVRKLYGKYLLSSSSLSATLVKAATEEMLNTIKFVETRADDIAAVGGDSVAELTSPIWPYNSDVLTGVAEKCWKLGKYMAHDVAMRYVLKIIDANVVQQTALFDRIFNANMREFKIRMFKKFSFNDQAFIRRTVPPAMMSSDLSNCCVLTHHETPITYQIIDYFSQGAICELNTWFMFMCLSVHGTEESLRAANYAVQSNSRDLDVCEVGTLAECRETASDFGENAGIIIHV
jgi:hypothetical protein